MPMKLRSEELGEQLTLHMQAALCKETFESAQSLTIGFGQRNASIWLSVKGRSQSKSIKKKLKV